MDQSLMSSVTELMSRHTFKLDKDPINEGLGCTECRKLAKDPYETYCGCTYCRRCIVELLERGHRHCRGIKDKCKEEVLKLEVNVKTSPMLNTRIPSARVRCPNRLCAFITELSNVEEHMRLCSLDSIKIPPSELFDSLKIGEGELGMAEERKIDSQTDGQSGPNIALLREQMEEQLRGICAKSEDQIRRLEVQETEMEKRRKETESLKRTVGRLEKESKTGESIMKEVTRLKNEIAEMRECSRNNNNTVQTSETLRKRIKELEEEVVLKDNDIKRKDERINDYEQEKERCAVDKGTIEQLKRENEELKKSICAAKQLLEKKQKAIDTMKSKLDEVNKLNASNQKK